MVRQSLRAQFEKIAQGEEDAPRPPSEVLENAGPLQRFTSCDSMSVVTILVGYAQVLALIPRAYRAVEWPSAYRATMSALQIVSSNPFAIAMPSCIAASLRLNAYTELWLMIFSLSPYGMIPEQW